MLTYHMNSHAHCIDYAAHSNMNQINFKQITTLPQKIWNLFPLMESNVYFAQSNSITIYNLCSKCVIDAPIVLDFFYRAELFVVHFSGGGMTLMIWWVAIYMCFEYWAGEFSNCDFNLSSRTQIYRTRMHPYSHAYTMTARLHRCHWLLEIVQTVIKFIRFTYIISFFPYGEVPASNHKNDVLVERWSL